MAQRQHTVEPVTHHEERLHRESRSSGEMRLEGLWLMLKGLAGIVLVAALAYGLYWGIVFGIHRWR
jgi:hypothetical protein